MPPASAPAADGPALLHALRAGDEAAFTRLVRDHSGVLFAVARCYDASCAERVVQETWLAVIDRLDRFDGRSSLSSWIVRLCRDAASARLRAPAAVAHARPELEAGRLRRDGEVLAGHWAVPPADWPTGADDDELHELAIGAIGRLPPAVRAAIALRDVAGLPCGDVCDALGISAAEERALLHRGRTEARAALARHLERLDGRVPLRLGSRGGA